MVILLYAIMVGRLGSDITQVLINESSATNQLLY